jgi:hypothetical protein
MYNIIKGDSLLVNTENGVIKVIFSHYSDKRWIRFWATNGREYDCKNVLV